MEGLVPYIWVSPKVLHASDFLSFRNLAIVTYFERLILEIDSSSTNPELQEYSWLELVIVDLPNQGGVNTRMVGDSIAYNREIILT
jgi:hypothetical protein